MNVVTLIGRLVADPDLKFTPSGVAVASMRIAVDRPFKSASGEKETEFIDVVAWRQRAEFVSNYGGKGRLLAVVGSLQVRSWVQQDGQKRYKTEVVADNLQLLDKPKENGGSGGDWFGDTQTDGGPVYPEDYDPFAAEA